MFGSYRKGFIFILSLLIIFTGSAFSSETVSSQSVNELFADYMQGINTKIKKTWNPPEVLETGHAFVVFKIDKNGNLISTYVKESSGNSLYDEAALQSIQKAAPYGLFPENASKEYITVVYSFDSSIVSKQQVKEIIEEADRFINRDNKTARSLIDKAIKSIEGDPAAYFLYARRCKIDKLLGDSEAAKSDLEKCKQLKITYDRRRIEKCKKALMEEETPFAYFALANAYDIAGDYNNAIYNIDKAISMTELNHAYKRYRSEIVMRRTK